MVARNASHVALPQPLRAATPGNSPAFSSSCLLVSEQRHKSLSSQGEERQGQDNWILTVVTAKLIELKTLKLTMTLTVS